MKVVLVSTLAFMALGCLGSMLSGSSGNDASHAGRVYLIGISGGG